MVPQISSTLIALGSGVSRAVKDPFAFIHSAKYSLPPVDRTRDGRKGVQDQEHHRCVEEPARDENIAFLPVQHSLESRLAHDTNHSKSPYLRT